MTGPYPDAETAAHMLAEELLIIKAESDDRFTDEERNVREGFVDGLWRAARALNVEDVVRAKLESS